MKTILLTLVLALASAAALAQDTPAGVWKAIDDDKALWDGGDITGPNNGKVYKVRIKPVEGGKKLEVRGCVGAPPLGKTQTWLRVE